MKRGIIISKHAEISTKNFFLIFIAILTLALIVLVYLLYFHTITCKNRDCFAKALTDCNKATLIKEDEEVKWTYTIIGKSEENPENSCLIKTTLNLIKQGNIDTEILIGKSMACDYFKHDTKFPEEDLSKCTGPLKEELQDIMIKRTHDYLLENLGIIKDTLDN